MFRPRRTHLLILISFQLLSSLALGQITTCDPNNRPSPGSCNSLPISGVCGYTDNNCPIEFCGKYYRNSCAACADTNVDHYTAGECPRDVQLLTCTEDEYCPLLTREEFDPVCGYGTENGEPVSKTFFNYCVLCDDNSVYSRYTPGVCQQDREYCTPGKLGCTREKDVCAFMNIPDWGFVPSTAPSIAEACVEPAVEYYIKGACGPLRDDKRYCFPNTRPEECDQEYDPVCGFYKDENGLIQHEIMPSDCTACADPSVAYWTPGPCVFKCDLDPNTIYDCTGVIIPVCGTWIENGVEKRTSFRNDCLGCYYSGRQVLTWTDGLCPGDKGILCANDSDMYEEWEPEQVCGYTTAMTEDCNDQSCRATYASARLACGDSSIVWYAPGPCA